MAGRARAGSACLLICIVVAAAIGVRAPALVAIDLRTTPPPPTQSSDKPVVFPVAAKYGTLTFVGTVERFDAGTEYEYRPHISITFHPDERPNRTPIANLVMCELVATIRHPGQERATVLARETAPMTVLMTQDGETKQMPEMTFRLPRSIAAGAGHVGLGVTDMHLLWPISTELK